MSETKLKAVGDQVIILPDPPKIMSGGIVIPEEARRPTNTGVIVAMPEMPDFAIGDRVVFNSGQGFAVPHGGKTYLSISKYYLLAPKQTEIMQPLHDRVLVKPIKKDETLSDGGVVMLEDQTINHGEVLVCGGGRHNDPMLLTAGDKVIYGKHAGIAVGDEVILTQSEVIAITEAAISINPKYAHLLDACNSLPMLSTPWDTSVPHSGHIDEAHAPITEEQRRMFGID